MRLFPKSMLAAVLVPFMALALTACTSVPLTSIPKLRKIEMRSTSVSELMIAISLPDIARPISGNIGVNLNLQAPGYPKLERKLQLVPVRNAKRFTELHSAIKPNRDLWVFQISAQDQAYLKSIRQRLLAIERQRKAQGHNDKGKGAFGLAVDWEDICLKAPFPSQSAQRRAAFDLYIRTSETKKFVKALRNVTVQKYAKAANFDGNKVDLNQVFKPCTTAR